MIDCKKEANKSAGIYSSETSSICSLGKPNTHCFLTCLSCEKRKDTVKQLRRKSVEGSLCVRQLAGLSQASHLKSCCRLLSQLVLPPQLPRWVCQSLCMPQKEGAHRLSLCHSWISFTRTQQVKDVDYLCLSLYEVQNRVHICWSLNHLSISSLSLDLASRKCSCVCVCV